MNGGVAKFGIGGVGELAAGGKLETEGSFGAESEMIFGGFPVDEKTRAARGGSGAGGAETVALFTDDEEQGEVARASGEKRFGGGDHGSDDAFGVAGTAAVDVRVVFARGEEGWNGVHVGGEGDNRFAKRKKDIVAKGCGILALEPGIVFCGEGREMGEEKIGDGFFVTSGGVEVHQSAREFEKVHRARIFFNGGKEKGRTREKLRAVATSR
jgi:hypothetical protein